MHQQAPRPAPRVASFLRSAEVAAILQVSPKTIARWAQQGLLPCQRTPSVSASGEAGGGTESLS
jgi:Helix-turn-helix domain